ncbi:uncharacterized protein MELLADRAFT_101257 [Melampsora larici-populina 98AG31]|uniref:Uncharacterized protein n=1 Tax=Melampsora larici-populina (strain 98AG31 / pathotype 3-4-7) TaxID=747676 RepID=F4R452_MELLP|nr:uncharacterized protein MELLADRAFT_101257 [Melampsora larici-populina 98AG31]EGG12741.1 hypothetical protein MELLADRAFT_101257 [Melampsora larici-populina 98AG31]
MPACSAPDTLLSREEFDGRHSRNRSPSSGSKMSSDKTQYHTHLTLKRFIEVQQNRDFLQQEFEQAIESSLSPTVPDLEQADHSLNDKDEDRTHEILAGEPPQISACRRTHVETEHDKEEYLQQVMAICTTGFLEIKSEVNLLAKLLREDLGVAALADLVEKVQNLAERKCLQRSLLQRKATLEQRDYGEEISKHEEKIAELSTLTLETMEEVKAEMIDRASDAA